MDLTNYLNFGNPSLIIFFATTLVALLSWWVKGAIEKPIIQSKQTFEKTFNIRIEILIAVKNRLSLLLYFPDGKHNKKFKKQIQKLLLQDGRSAYLSKVTLDNTMKISIDETNDMELIKNTITQINCELVEMISKVEEEIKFYKKFSNLNPVKKTLGIVLLSIQNIILIFLIGIGLILLVYYFIYFGIIGKILLTGISIILVLFINNYLSHSLTLNKK